MGMGLIGTALAGAAMGGGYAGEKAGLQYGKYLGDRELQAEKVAADKDLGITLENMRQSGENTRLDTREGGSDRRLGVTEGGADRRLGVTETGATTRQNAGFTHTETMAALRQAFDTEQKKLDRDLTREQITSNERIGAANNATALAAARIGGSVQTDKEGNVFFIDKEGKTKLVDDPNNPGQPMKSLKDLTPAAKQYADVLKAQLVGLDKEEIAALDPASKQAIVERRGVLMKDLLNVMTGGIDSAGKVAPSGKTGWDSTSGQVYKNGQVVGTARSEAEARKMAAGGAPGATQATTTASTPAGLIEEPPGSVEKEKPPGLIARKRQQLLDEKAREEERRAEYGQAGY